MRVFITGATGEIGRRAVPLMIAAGHRVTAVSRSAQAFDLLRRLGATPVEADLFDVARLRRALAGHDAVVNLATHVPSSSTKMLMRRYWRENDRIRRDASLAIATAARAEGLTRMVQESFALIYPDSGDAWIDESMPVSPVGYTESILDAERSANQFTETGGTGVILRFAALYGPDSTLLEMIRFLRKGWSPLPGDPRAYFSSLAQDDAAAAVVAALGVPPGTYNISDDQPLRRAEWADSLATALGLPRPKAIPSWMVRLGGPTMRLLSRSERISNRRFRDAASWAPKYRSVRDAWRDVVGSLHDGRAVA
ncbi:MAG TPA: NAD(P)-dependent oxidoreductase [Gemmatimonadaceae bacterium]|nr:NAD(P)-dependent oxidoreductase [Gemmatimonadaceae bacterium]